MIQRRRPDAARLHLHPKAMPIAGLERKNRMARQPFDVARDHIQHPPMGYDQYLLVSMAGTYVAKCLKHAVGKFVHSLSADELRRRIAPQNLLKLCRIQFSQFIFRDALNGAEIALLQPCVDTR